jgi:hypothetical protein
MLLSGDLGLLLRRCCRVAVRDRWRARVLTAEALIHWRALQVVTATPCLPSQQKLREIFPSAILDEQSFLVLMQEATPETVLAECLRFGILVTESRIVYHSRGRGPPLS